MDNTDKNEKKDVKEVWEAPTLIKLDVDETNTKPKMYFSEFNASYGAVS